MSDPDARRVPPPRRSDAPPDPDAEDDLPEIGGRRVRPGDKLGEYEVIRIIGSGGMAHVLLAEHRTLGAVALKVLKRSRLETGLSRFRREYRALSRINHPNVIRVHDYGDLHGHPYIAMEFVEGEELHAVIRRFRELTGSERNQRARRILGDLCRALSAVHRRGLVHRDLKPSNILVAHDGTCKLTDFGIVKDLDPDNTPELSTTLAGTWAYAAPEHIMGRPVDHRADLYALGVIVFVMLTGRRPFVADGMAGYLRAHRDESPARPIDLVPSIAPELDAICMRLLEKAPRDRFQSAQEILYRLELDPADPVPDGEWSPPLVGTDEVRARLDDAVAGLTAARGGILRVIGDEGSGRSRWLEYVAERARTLGVPVHPWAFEDNPTAFDAALALARRMASELADAPSADELRRVLDVWTTSGTPDGDTRYALFDALSSALGVLLESGPRVLLLDDADRMPPEDRDLLRYLARRLIQDADAALLVVVSEAPAPQPPAWASGLPTVEARLAPLSLEALTSIVASALGPGRLTQRLAERLQEETDGNPLFVVQFLRSLMARGIIEPHEGRWRPTVDADDLVSGHLEIPPGIRQLLTRRLDHLDKPSLDVLRVLSVAGGALDLDVLAEVVMEDEDVLLDQLDDLLERGLVREFPRGEDPVWTVVHRKLGELVVQQLPADRARLIHARLGEAIAQSGRQDPDTLMRIGEHLRRGGRPGAAFTHLAAAARRLVDRHLLTHARETVQRGLAVRDEARDELGPAAFAPLDHDLMYARGVVLANRGRWSAAVDVFRELIERAPEFDDPRATGEDRLQLARAARRTGGFEEALRAAETALQDARGRQDRAQVAAALHALSMLAWIEGDMERCEALADEGLLLCRNDDLRAQRAQLHIARAVSEATRGQLASAARGMEEAEHLLDALRMRQPWVLAVANLGEVLAWQGRPGEAWTRADEAVRAADALDYALGRIVALRTRGTAALDLGRRWDGTNDLHTAVDLARSVGVHEERLAVAAVLTRHAIDNHDPVGAMRHAADGLAAIEAGGRDPERHLPVLHAHLAHALVRRDPRQAAHLLLSVEDALPTLPGPRALFTRMAMARAWEAAGDRSRAVDHAERLLEAPHARSFRRLTVETRAMLVRLTTGESRRRHRTKGRDQLDAYLRTLPPEVALSVRTSAQLRPLLDDDSSSDSLA